MLKIALNKEKNVLKMHQQLKNLPNDLRQRTNKGTYLISFFSFHHVSIRKLNQMLLTLLVIIVKIYYHP